MSPTRDATTLWPMPHDGLIELASHWLERHTLGPYATNCYVLWPKVPAASTHECWIIDASFEPSAMIESIRAQQLSPTHLIFTHAHIDHIAGAFEVHKAFPNLKVMIHPLEEAWLLDPQLNLSTFTGMPVTAPAATATVPEGTLLGDAPWRVLHLPGHSPGSIGLYCESDNVIISGDVLFQGSVGRTDFPGCSQQMLSDSILTKLYTLPDRTTLYPGHGPPTTIGAERTSNPFVRGGR